MRDHRFDKTILQGMTAVMCSFACLATMARGDEAFEQAVETDAIPVTIPVSTPQEEFNPSIPELPIAQPLDTSPVEVDETSDAGAAPMDERELKPEHQKVDKNYAAPDEEVEESKEDDSTPIQESAEKKTQPIEAPKEQGADKKAASEETPAELSVEKKAPAEKVTPAEVSQEKSVEKKKAPSVWKNANENKALTPGPVVDKNAPKVKTQSDVKEVKETLLPKLAQQPILRQSRGSIVEFQGSRTQQNLSTPDMGGKRYEVSLINLNPTSNAWFVLEIRNGSAKPVQYHIENTYPATQNLKLDANFPNGIILANRRGEERCELWGAKNALADAQKGKPYMPLCNERLYLRNRIEGYRTTKEWVVEFLRDKMWGGEQITSFVKKTVFKDEYLLQSNVDGKKAAAKVVPPAKNTPPMPLLKPDAENGVIAAKALGFKLKDYDDKGQIPVGKWMELAGVDHVYVSTLQTNLIADEILNSHKDIVKPLDNVESSAQVYMTAFDLSFFDVGFALGTEHPRLGWSERVRESDRVKGWPGPDGFDNAMPLIATGLLNPLDARRVVATFTGGFKRSHSAFKWGDLASKNRGSHYGFIEQGVVFSTLQPGLATIVMDRDGRLSMKTWREEDNATLQDIRFARQNGVPIIDYDPATQQSKPGKFVSNWMHGNWSGSEDMKFRTLRAGMCWVNSKEGQFLLYGYFSSVTPSAMARIFQAYGCQYAMHLDMNALEHTYLATYIEKEDKNYYPQHLINGMKMLDERFEGNVPRFIGYPDNRDFFFVLRRFREGLVK